MTTLENIVVELITAPKPREARKVTVQPAGTGSYMGKALVTVVHGSGRALGGPPSNGTLHRLTWERPQTCRFASDPPRGMRKLGAARRFLMRFPDATARWHRASHSGFRGP